MFAPGGTPIDCKLTVAPGSVSSAFIVKFTGTPGET